MSSGSRAREVWELGAKAEADEQTLLDERKLRAWYEMLRRFPAAYGCDAELVVLPAVVEIGDGVSCYGSFHPIKNIISVALLDNPYETLGTLFHEIAHAASNPRHRRHHGYSWRRQYSDLFEQVTGVALLPLATGYRRKAHAELGVRPSRMTALDILCVVTLTGLRPYVEVGPERVRLVVPGHKRFATQVQIPG